MTYIRKRLNAQLWTSTDPTGRLIVGTAQMFLATFSLVGGGCVTSILVWTQRKASGTF